ncbi:hypothetical protein U0070_002952 [Myodes glareolus]|uniref:Uncharacterized protein n=1 Tax=Myodes glareolus TaxID=447135 RepID=A0AAW0HN07_MYOGA
MLPLPKTHAGETHADASSLCYNYTVSKLESGSWKQEVQGQLNEKTFISCDNGNKCHSTGLLRDRLNATESWEAQFDTLKDGVYWFRNQVIDMKQENNTIRGLQQGLGLWDKGKKEEDSMGSRMESPGVMEEGTE